ncbi:MULTISPECIES: CHAT domain-containing protein [unclassified Microcoleus]|uniref:CHAT domain-containing protein n=1 Tax=unclassified Microcoleus TaxID=2642155 RepID=UPI001D210C19|nr:MULTISPECIES: CHAT domain-containing protein [unclassified Microcoleus]MCC3584264.1 CHAT domain-containing protein [Microcoleus sp. PH2017_30_WIL_O_A]MCC3590515.1 CHAT domain-containing protein [Microcoleus sp. PH2017_28_MFU_U_A]
MVDSEIVDDESLNEDSYDGLVSLIEASKGVLSLLIVSCQPGDFQTQMINRYEAELAPNIPCYRVVLNQQEPSLRAALEQLVEDYPQLKEPHASAAITVTGTEALMGFVSQADSNHRSELSRFFGYLQWTREALREFPYPIVIWVAPNILSRLSLEAPDFWSWRSGVFRFVAPTVEATGVINRNGEIFLLIEPEKRPTLPLDELLEQVENLEQQTLETPALATLYNRVANAYANRVNTRQHEDYSQEIDRAIHFFEKSLVLQRELNFRLAESDTLLQLGDIYRDLGLWERVFDLYEQSLAIARNFKDSLREAAALGRLGNLYQQYPLGDRANNLEGAIAFYTAALIVYTRDAFPEDWAMTQNNLAVAYSHRIKGEKAENIEQSMECYQSALCVYTRDTFPEQWAMTQNNLAIAYSNRIRGDRADNIEMAIASYNAALTVYSRDTFPEKWAMTQNNLGNAYSNRIMGEKAQNIEMAIVSYNAALSVLTRESFPEYWANTQINLANAYRNKIRGDKADNLEKAIGFYTVALEVITRQAFPQNHAETLLNLGLAYRDVPNLQLAYNTFADAINNVEILRDEIHSGDESKQKLAEEWNKLYQNMVEVCIELKNYTAAIEYAERSKARNLVELLATRDLYPKGDIPETVINELSRLRREIDAEQRRLDNQQTNRNSNGGTISGERSLQIDSLPTSRDFTHLTKLRKQLDELIAREITPIDPHFSLTQKVKPILYKDIQTLTGENTAILEWYITGDKFFTFIITPQTSTPIIWQSSTANFETLVNWYDEYRKDYEESKPPERKPQWKQKLASRFQNLAEILQLDRILENIPKQCDRLILIPHRFLHLFPLHALPISHERDFKSGYTDEIDSSITVSLSKSESCLLDLFPGGVSYAPSCLLLQQVKQRQRPNFSHLFAIANPTKDLYLLELQATNICHQFQSNDLLVRDNANKNAILNSHLRLANCIHFACHSKFEPDSPLESFLVLANNERLTLLEILNLDLNQCRLVTLCASETGLTESKTSDEYIGLPFGFLLAGSPSIVSTLWEVDQLASTLLLMRFYENLETLSTVTALNEAQQWMRNLTSEGLKILLKDLEPQIDQVFDRLTLKERTRFVYALLHSALNRKPFPFAEPYYWAAFTAIGV